MNKKKKRQMPPNPGPSQPSGKVLPPASAAVSADAEPVAERRPVPVFLIILLVLLVYLGDMYIMEHGADVLGKAGPFPKTVFDPYTTYEQLVEANPVSPFDKIRRDGRVVFNLGCVVCHQANGMGLSGQCPPLAGSDWVNAEGPNRIIRIVLNGASGPMTVSGQQVNYTMPPWKGTFTEEQIANALTFIRSEWGNKASPVTPEQVKKVEAQLGDRTAPMTEAELKNLPDKVE